MQIRASYRRLVATMARKYISKVTFELSAIIGEPTMRKVTRAVLTSDTSSALDANPIHGRQRPRRRAIQIRKAAMAAVTVTANPVT